MVAMNPVPDDCRSQRLLGLALEILRFRGKNRIGIGFRVGFEDDIIAVRGVFQKTRDEPFGAAAFRRGEDFKLSTGTEPHFQAGGVLPFQTRALIKHLP